MIRDCVEFIKRCQVPLIPRQVHKANTSTPTCYHALIATPSLWYRYCWPLEKTTAREYKYILVAIVYLLKWARPSQFVTSQYWLIVGTSSKSGSSIESTSQKPSWAIMVNCSRVRCSINYRPSISLKKSLLTIPNTHKLIHQRRLIRLFAQSLRKWWTRIKDVA